jgi:hypothetical protein
MHMVVLLMIEAVEPTVRDGQGQKFRRPTHQQPAPWKARDTHPPEMLLMTRESMHDRTLEDLALNLGYSCVAQGAGEVVQRN